MEALLKRRSVDAEATAEVYSVVVVFMMWQGGGIAQEEIG